MGGLTTDSASDILRRSNREAHQKQESDMNKQDLLDQRELIQNDLSCVLDGIDDEIMNRVCDVIVQRFAILLDRYDARFQDDFK